MNEMFGVGVYCKRDGPDCCNCDQWKKRSSPETVKQTVA